MPDTPDQADQLVTLAQTKDYLQIPSADTTHDTQLTTWIFGCTPVIEHITGPMVPREYDEWYDGGQYAIRLRHRPIITLEAVSIYLGPVEYPMSIVTQPQAGSIFSVMADGGRRIVRRGPGGSQLAFPGGYQSVHVRYVAGYATVPYDVQIATLELIRENYLATQTPGGPRTGSESLMGVDSEGVVTALPVGFLVSPRVREFLSPHRRAPTIV